MTKNPLASTSVLLAAGLLIGLPSYGQDSPGPAGKDEPTLKPSELADAKSNFTIPGPGEVLTAAADTIDLKAIVGKISPSPEDKLDGSDAILAHTLGELLANGFICLHAKEAEKTKAIGRQLLAVGEKLGADELVLEEGKKIGALIDAESWADASIAADTFRGRLLANLAQSGDADLVTIISASGWLHGFSLIATQIDASYNEDASRQLRQSDLAAHLAARVAALPEGRVKDAAKAAAALTEISKLTAVDKEAAISKEAVAKIAAAGLEGMSDLEGVQNEK